MFTKQLKLLKDAGINGLRRPLTGILRSVLRQGVRSLDDLEDGIAKIAIETSHPKWLIERWIELYGKEDAVAMAHENNNPASVTMRVNTAKTTVDEAIAALKSEGIELVARGSSF